MPLYAPQAAYEHQSLDTYFRPYYDRPLTIPQQVVTMGGVSLGTAILSRPIFNSHEMFFMSRSAFDLPVPRKWARARDTVFMNWFKESRFGHGPVLAHAGGMFASLVVYNSTLGLLEAQYSPIPNPVASVIAGATTGFVISLGRHPLEALTATKNAPGPDGIVFKSRWDVVKTSLQLKPKALLGLYNGFVMNSMATICYYTAFFGFYNLFEYDGYIHSEFRLIPYAYASACLAETVRYPFRRLKEELSKLNSTNRYKPMSYVYLLQKMRKNGGMTQAYTGFFASHPFMRAWSGALLLGGLTHATQQYRRLLDEQEGKTDSSRPRLLEGHRNPKRVLGFV